MFITKGPYGPVLSVARERGEFISSLLVVFEGNEGPGYAAYFRPGILETVPQMLRDIADQIEETGYLQRWPCRTHLP